MHTGNILIYRNTQAKVNMDVHLYEGKLDLNSGVRNFRTAHPTPLQEVSNAHEPL